MSRMAAMPTVIPLFRRGLSGILLAFFCSAASSVCLGSENWGQVRGYVCHKATVPPVLDGLLNDACWESARGSEGFSAVGAPAGNIASPRTAVWICYDDVALYLAFECEEPLADALPQGVHERDFDVYMEEMVGILLDVGHQRSEHYDVEIALSAAGTVYDFGWDLKEGWNGQWDRAVHRDESHGLWWAEISVPWEDTRQVPKQGDVWGLQMMRWRNASGTEESFVWSAVPSSWELRMWEAPTFGHLFFDQGGPGLRGRIRRVNGSLLPRREEIQDLSRGRPEMEAKVNGLYERLAALKDGLPRKSEFSGDDWSARYAEADAIESAFGDLFWQLKIDDLLSD